MLMKWLVTLCLVLGRHLGWAPETITRIPNALAGGVSILVIAWLGRRLFGSSVGLFAAALASLCCTFIGYQRVAKEDTLLGLFILLLCGCLAEAKAAADDASAGNPTRQSDQRRWELYGAFALAGMMASKYFAWHLLLAPIFVFSIRKTIHLSRPPEALAAAGAHRLCALDLHQLVPLPPQHLGVRQELHHRPADRARQPLLHGPHLP